VNPTSVTPRMGEVIEKLRRSTVAVKANRSGGGGSGVIWAGEGTIVTNAHVVETSGSAVQVELWDGRRLPAKIAQRDRRRDLAVLKTEATDLPAVTAGDSTALRPGELVIAVGNPLGFIGAASTGVVHSFHDRSWVVSQLRLAPGNSGGPLANARGEVVGINTMIAGGLAFAVPSRTVARFLNQNVGPEFELGVMVRPVWLDRSSREFGLLVLELTPGSAAERASLLQGDVLVGANGERFQTVQDLEMALEASRCGILELQFRRAANSNIRSVAVSLARASKRAA
jgi:serine protease Do